MAVEATGAPRAHAGLGEVALATGAVAAARSLGPTMTARGMSSKVAGAGVAGGLGMVAGLAGEGAARGLDATTGLDRFQSHLAVGAAGLATALAGRHIGGTPAAVAASVGSILAVTGGAGAALDLAHQHLDTDGDGHFLPPIPRGVELGVGAAVVGGLALKYGGQAISASRNAKLLAGSAASGDAAGAALGELIPRSQLTIGPRIFLGARIEDGFGSVAKRAVMPHRIDAPEARVALGLPATGTLDPDQLAQLAVRSMDQQGAYAVDAAGKPMVDIHVLGSPTGMGGLNLSPVMMTEQLRRTATIDAQYGAKPSVQSLGAVDEAIDQWVAVAAAHKARMAQVPTTERVPTVGVATSLGGLQFDELIAKRGHQVLDELGVDRIVTLGGPVRLSKLDPSTLPEGFHIRATFDEFAGYSDEQVATARFIELMNADDAVPLVSTDMLWKRPGWFPADRPFTPGVSMVQHALDITGQISRGTGPKVGSGGHEYRSVQSNLAFARALGLGNAGDEGVEAAAVRAQDVAVAEAKRAREVLLGGGAGPKKPA